jgi:ABC-type taurine transport system ATPase subunit
MISKLTLRNFKSIGEQEYAFTNFDLLVGRNNSGKSTILQALAIWQFCLDGFHQTKRSGSKGIQVVLPNFTALPVPEFNLLWKDRTDRHWPVVNGHKKQEYILIEIIVEWCGQEGEAYSFGVSLRYHSAQTIYAIPVEGWARFGELDKLGVLPRIAYVPPFSGLEPVEKWLDKGNIREQVGKAQPGSVLRNLLLQVCPTAPRDDQGRVLRGHQQPEEWRELNELIDRWFSVKLMEPDYRQGVDTRITVEYKPDKSDKRYDIIAGGSGFHQTLTLLAFLYGYSPTTILMDEPDAHLHVNLQREILDYFKRKSTERNVQFLIATHAEEFANGVDATQIVSLLGQAPKRVESTPEIIRAMADVSNAELTRLWSSPIILYVEGESDERILRAWAITCGAEESLAKVCFHVMGGGTKKIMNQEADKHFDALRLIIPEVQRLKLFDYDDVATWHPEADNPAVYEWSRKNIENYLLVPDAWVCAALKQMGHGPGDLFGAPMEALIRDYFAGENLTLPPGKSWRDLKIRTFSEIDGKKLLFEDDGSLFQALRNQTQPVELIRETVAGSMTIDEIHEDVHQFFGKLAQIVSLMASAVI